MPICTSDPIRFQGVKGRKVEAVFSSQTITNDHDELRYDPALQTAVGRDVDMASASTLCRFENSVDAKSLWSLSSVPVDVFIESYKKAPEEIILNFDAN